MKNVKLSFIFLGLISLVAISCSKKEAEVRRAPIVPPTEVPPTSTVTTGLTISQGANLAEPKFDLEEYFVYTSGAQSTVNFKSLPATYNDKIKSINIPRGYMAVLSENQNGTGESICYVAAVNDIRANLPQRLVDKVSFVRFVPINNVNKKGLGLVIVNDINAINSAWYYNWGLNPFASPNKQHVPMTWGKGSATTTTALNLIARKDIDHYLSFNEPDNRNQSNIVDIDTAITRYRLMLQTGLRMCSPAVEQDNALDATDWLPRFMAAATAQKLRVDVVALHWYDWGNERNNLATPEATAAAVLNRFKNYIERVRIAYPNQTLWFTEYNCNPNRSADVHQIFMRESAAYLNTLPYVERYAYFFPAVHPVSSGAPNFTLTPIGQTWSDIVSVPSFSANIVPR
jgi:hypothetical protein